MDKYNRLSAKKITGSVGKRLIPTIKSGNELFKFNNTEAGFKLLEFWQWSVSDLVSNATRGRLAEFIVAKALGIDTANIPRDEWQSFDLTTPDGIKVEVKSAAYIQSWFQEKESLITFSIKRTRYYDPETGKLLKKKDLWADVYVYCLLNYPFDQKQNKKIDPLNLNQWEFYVLSKKDLEDYKRSQDSITLKSLQKKVTAVSFSAIKETLFVKLVTLDK